MSAVVTVLAYIAEAFPRVKNSAGTKRNWLYFVHLDSAEALPKIVMPPKKYGEGARAGVYVDMSRTNVLRFSQMPFLSDVGFMLASDLPNRVERAMRCLDDAQEHIGKYQISSLLEHAIYSLIIAASSAQVPEEHRKAYGALLIGYSVAAIFAKIYIGKDTNAVPFTWGENVVFTASIKTAVEDISKMDGKDIVSDFCLIQAMSVMSYLARVGGIKATEQNCPAKLFIEDHADKIFLCPWGPGWIISELIMGFYQNDEQPCRYKKINEVLNQFSQIVAGSMRTRELAIKNALSGLPKIDSTSYDIYRSIIENQKYALWPGITDVRWAEDGLTGLTLMPTEPRGFIYALLFGKGGQADSDRWFKAGEDFMVFLEIPPLKSAEEWEIVRLNIQDGFLDELAIPMEAIRMCCVPVEQKVRQNRIPDGYVAKAPGTKKKSSGIRVTYVPRIRYTNRKDEESEGNSSGATGTGRKHATHQVGAFIRQLPIGWHASASARSVAAEVGIELPIEGATFVRAHVRGKGLSEGSGDDIKKVKIRPQDRAGGSKG